MSKLHWINSVWLKLKQIGHDGECSSFILLILRKKCSKTFSSVHLTLFHSFHSCCTITNLVACLSFSLLSNSKRSHLMLPSLHTNIPGKHPSWEPAGGELKHYYQSHQQQSDQAGLEWLCLFKFCPYWGPYFLLYQLGRTAQHELCKNICIW